MPRTALLLAGLGAALLFGGLAAVRSEAVPDSNQTAWAEQHVENVAGGQVYRLDGCVTVTAPGLTSLSLRVAWYEEPDGSGSAGYEDAHADPQMVSVRQCLSLTNADAPCAARSARYGVWLVPDPDAVNVSGLEFSVETGATPVPCPTPTPTPPPAPTPTPRATATPAVEPTVPPGPSATPSPPGSGSAVDATGEPTLFPALVNGGFEDVRDDGTPYGWHKIGGEMTASNAFRAEGDRSAALVSRTESTKWLYQAVSVEGGSYYRLRAKVLKSDPGVEEALLRISWYASLDGSGSQLSTADSPAVARDSPEFVALDTGPVEAPPEARSAKARLLVRPSSSAPAVVYFDHVRFGETAAPTGEGPVEGEQSAQDAAEGGPTVLHETFQRPPLQRPAPARAAALGSWAGPTSLANVREAREQQDEPAAGDSRPLWPLLLAIAMPAAGLTAMAGHAWWRARLAAGNGRHL